MAHDDETLLTGDEAIDKVRQLLPRFRSAMMITQGSDGQVHGRPMGLQGDVSVFGGTLWFFVDDRSRKVQESMNGRPVSFVFQNDDQNPICTSLVALQLNETCPRCASSIRPS